MREESRSRHGLGELAARQHGVVSSGQLRGLGLSTSAIGREAGTGRLYPLCRGVYAVGHGAISRHGACLAAVLACGDGAVLSHSSAAWLWGMTSAWAKVMHVTAAGPRPKRPNIVVHSSARLSKDDRGLIEGVPTTAVPRTLLDLAALRPRAIGGAVQRAERLGLLELIALDDLLCRCRGARGAARLRDALLAYRDPAFTRSGLERHFLGLVMAAGLPRPATNLFVEGYELDTYWPAERFAVELDTFEYHGGRRAFESDRVRQENLKLAGI
jgi:Transcriptional regulator, AbiEi antitoxin